ncbi:MAG: histidine--tRNA ligase [Clostridia bacterium]|nr:histidine--tRNA ligase [Clostridia bacterium]
MIKIPKGTKDVLPSNSAKWHLVEENIKKLAKKYALNEIRTPIFEHTELFLRGVGDTTDIVNKEMYTFLDKADRSITLKPEGTACVARSFIENGLDSAGVMPVKMYYETPVFRYENPQSGRLREHHQFGVEIYGSASAYTDAEVISIAKDMLESMQVANVKLYINSIGCADCRKKYNEALRTYLANSLDSMCPQCKERFDKNPLRILDCKEDKCKLVTKSAPRILDYLCGDCKDHFDKLKHTLDLMNILYTVKADIVRGLDYYTGTVFEFVAEDVGLTVCGGGRYNGLLEQIGGKPTPAVGFGMGIERLLQVANADLIDSATPNVPTIYFAPMQEYYDKAISLTAMLREAGISADTDHIGRSLKAQMKYAGKLGVRFVGILGEDELKQDAVSIKDMQIGETQLVKIADLINYIEKKVN